MFNVNDSNRGGKDNLISKMGQLFKEQDKKRNQENDLIKKLKFLHPDFWDKYINEMLDGEERKKLFEMLASDKEGKEGLQLFCDNIGLQNLCDIIVCCDKIESMFDRLPEDVLKRVLNFMPYNILWKVFNHLDSSRLILLEDGRLVRFLEYILQDRKKDNFNLLTQNPQEELKNKLLKIFCSMPEARATILLFIPNCWLDEVLDFMQKEIVSILVQLPDDEVIKILLRCNKKNFCSICKKMIAERGDDFFAHEDISNNNMVDFLKRLKKYEIEISSIFTCNAFVNCYKITNFYNKKVLLYDIIPTMEEETQEKILRDLYISLDKNQKLQFLKMISSDDNEEGFLTRKLINIQIVKILQTFMELEVFEKEFLAYFTNWLKNSIKIK